MADIHIHRAHDLGLEQARKIAWQWAEQVEEKFDMECTVIEGETSDTVEFTRSGVSGRLIVAGDHFDLDAKLGFLLGAFSKTIESEIEKNLDELLSGSAAKKAGAKAGAERKSAPAPSARAADPAPSSRKSNPAPSSRKADPAPSSRRAAKR